jgi:hypothetical protein
VKFYIGKNIEEGVLVTVEDGSVRLSYEGRGPDEDCTMAMNITREGLILDIVDPEGEIVSTAAVTVDDLEGMCH